MCRLYDLLTGGSGAFPALAEDEAWYDPYYRFLEEALDNQGESGPRMMRKAADRLSEQRK